jgi:hypothetical protein
MSSSALSLIFQSASCVAALLVLWLVCVAQQRVAFFRRKMFVLREELFDFARAGDIGFDHPSYKLLRNLMNGFIRYAHRLTCFQIFLTFARWGVTEEIHPLTWNVKWKESLLTVADVSTRERLTSLHGRAMDAVANHLVSGSPLLTLAFLAAILVMLLQGAWTSVSSLLRAAAERTVEKFLDARKIEELSVRA